MKLKEDIQNWLNGSSDTDEYKNLSTKIRELDYECTLMFRYISSIGKEIPDDIISEMSELSQLGAPGEIGSSPELFYQTQALTPRPG